MKIKNIFLYSFKERRLFAVDNFFGKNDEFYFKLIDEDRILVCEYDRKIIISMNEIFRFRDEVFSFVTNQVPIVIFLNKNDEKFYFCLLSFGKDGLKNIILNFVFVLFILKFFSKLIFKNFKIIILIFFIFILNFHKNIVIEDVREVSNNYLLQRKLNIGYQNIMSLVKNIDEDSKDNNSAKTEEKKMTPILKINTGKINRFIKKLEQNKMIDKDTEYFLKMNKNIKKK